MKTHRRDFALQLPPPRTPEGKALAKAFARPPVLNMDYANLELRIAALGIEAVDLRAWVAARKAGKP